VGVGVQAKVENNDFWVDSAERRNESRHCADVAFNYRNVPDRGL